MTEFIEAYWPYLVVALAILIVLAAYLALANRRASVISDRRDVLDEGAERAKRNQALIDAPRRSDDPAPPPAQSQAATAAGDDLTRIKGLGPKIATLLGEMGITRFADIAAWDDADIDRIDAQLGRFQGRIRRDAWVEQAALLSSGDEAGFKAKFGKTE